VPRFGAALLFFSLAALGLPGMGNFIGEFLALLGTFRASVLYASIAAVGLAPALVYALWLVDRTLYGPQKRQFTLPDLTARETALVVLLGLAILWLGLAPQCFLNLASGALATLQQAGGVR
jgi:NADH-quinone oxidoreductase subunit M